MEIFVDQMIVKKLALLYILQHLIRVHISTDCSLTLVTEIGVMAEIQGFGVVFFS
jgi:hypothetical protein